MQQNGTNWRLEPVQAENKTLLYIYDDVTEYGQFNCCLLYTSPSPRDGATSRMPSSA